MYNNEDTLGAGIRASNKPRSELFVTTKLNGKALTPGQTIKESLKESLAKLGLDYVDLFLIHDPTPATKEGNSKLADWWKQMEDVHMDGLAKAIGVSNFRVEDLNVVLETGKVIPAANQVFRNAYICFFDLFKNRNRLNFTLMSGKPPNQSSSSVKKKAFKSNPMAD